MGCVGVVGVLEFRFSTCFLSGWGVGLLGCSGEGSGGFVGVCFGSGRSILGLHIIYVMNVISLIFLGRRCVVNETWLMWESLYIRSLMLIDNAIANNEQCMSVVKVLCSYFLMGS